MLVMVLNVIMIYWERLVIGFLVKLFVGLDKDGYLILFFVNFMVEGKLIGGGVLKE